MIVGICGGSGSGKTTVAKKLAAVLGEESTVWVAQDSYYKDNNHLPFADRDKINYDHPESVDFGLLIDHLNRLKRNEAIDCPQYDFTEHLRARTVYRLEPKPIILVEGILILHEPRLRKLFDVKAYVDTDPDVRFIRRLKRDVRDRGRTMESVVEQYLNSVRPMHWKFVEPCKELADIILPEGGKNIRNIDILAQFVKSRLK